MGKGKRRERAAEALAAAAGCLLLFLAAWGGLLSWTPGEVPLQPGETARLGGAEVTLTEAGGAPSAWVRVEAGDSDAVFSEGSILAVLPEGETPAEGAPAPGTEVPAGTAAEFFVSAGSEAEAFRVRIGGESASWRVGAELRKRMRLEEERPDEGPENPGKEGLFGPAFPETP